MRGGGGRGGRRWGGGVLLQGGSLVEWGQTMKASVFKLSEGLSPQPVASGQLSKA